MDLMGSNELGQNTQIEERLMTYEMRPKSSENKKTHTRPTKPKYQKRNNVT